MEQTWSLAQLADEVNKWCDDHGVVPANGQAGERITERSVRYYRTLGLVDAPLAGGGLGYGEKHRSQLKALRLLQAQGIPLRRIRSLLLGRSIEDLQRIERQGLQELPMSRAADFPALAGETWGVTPLGEDYLLISRRGLSLASETCQELLAVLNGKPQTPAARAANGKETEI
jgi:DNA-binding transcriptional MerR regulator